MLLTKLNSRQGTSNNFELQAIRSSCVSQECNSDIIRNSVFFNTSQENKADVSCNNDNSNDLEEGNNQKSSRIRTYNILQVINSLENTNDNIDSQDNTD